MPRSSRPGPRPTPLGVHALPMGEFTFAAVEPYAGQTGVVVAYAIRHAGGVFLFDTGFGVSATRARRVLPGPRPPTARGACRGSASTLPRSPRWPTATCTWTTRARTPCSRASRSTSSRPNGDRARDRVHDPRLDRLSRRPTYEQVEGDHEPVPGIRDLRHTGPLAGSPVARRRHARTAWSCWRARPSTATASGRASRARGKARAARWTGRRYDDRSRDSAR